MKQVSKASQLNKSVKQVSLASQVKQVGLASQVSNLPKSSQESEIKKVLVKQVQVKQVKSSKFKLSNLNQASEVMLDRDTAPRKRPSPSLSGTKNMSLIGIFRSGWGCFNSTCGTNSKYSNQSFQAHTHATISIRL